MTTQVKQVPKRPETKVKIEPKRETTPEPSASSGMGIANIYAGDVADSTNVDPNNSSANPVDNLWVNYKGTGQDVRDEPAGEHQTVEISGHQVRFPPPPAKNTSKLPSSKRATSQNVKVLKKRGRASGSPSSEPKTFLINMHKTIVMRMTDSHVLTPLHMEAKGQRKASPRKENPKILANQKDRENQRIQEKGRIMTFGKGSKEKGKRYHGTDVTYYPTYIYGCPWNTATMTITITNCPNSGLMTMMTHGGFAGDIEHLPHEGRHMREGVDCFPMSVGCTH